MHITDGVWRRSADPLACVEVGASSVQTVLFASDGAFNIHGGALHPKGSTLALAVPGIIGEGVVTVATNLGWRNTDPVTALGLRGPAACVLNDGEAAALGEAALRDDETHLVYFGIGTGIGGAVVRDGAVERDNLFGHNARGYGTGFGSETCRCGRIGCLETVASGWSLPDPIDAPHLAHLAGCVAKAVDHLPIAQDGVVVLGGGIPRRYPVLVDLVSSRLRRAVEPSAAPSDAKSAAAWGLRSVVAGQRLARAWALHPGRDPDASRGRDKVTYTR